MGTVPRIFLADDDEDDQLLFLQALKDIHPAIECMMASNGVEALRLLQSDLFTLPDYIFIDLNMPLLDGLACLNSLKKDPLLKTIPAILYSTTVTPEFAAECRRLGAHSVFKKPDDFNGLKEHLRALLS